MKRVKTYEDFTAGIREAVEGDLHKVYVALGDAEGHRFWNAENYAGEKFFKKITLDNYDEIEINQDYPILSYNSKVIKALLDNNLIKIENVYNRPEHIKKSSSKAEFHKILDGDENIPKTAFTPEDAVKIGFPLIAKPAEGHSGAGIQIFKSKEEFDAADHDKFDIYSQYIDKKSEHRLVTFKGELLHWLTREPMNDKAKSGDGEKDSEMLFKYIKRNKENTPERFTALVDKFSKIFKDLPYICFDVMEDQDGKLYVIESNSGPGVPFDLTVQLYRVIFKDFYGREVNSETDKKLAEISDYLDRQTTEREPDLFQLEKN
jgi:hypothetical protein